MLMSAPTQHDMKEWINAFRRHQIDTMEARSRFFEKKLERSGVRVPRASILMTQGLNAPLLAANKPNRTQSAGPAQLQSMNSLLPAAGRQAAASMVAIKESHEDEDDDKESVVAPKVSDVRSKNLYAEKVVFHYFGQGNGRADPLRQMFEYHGQPYEKVDETQEGWEQKKAAGGGGEFGGGLPFAIVSENGQTHRIAQFGAILHHFGVRYGYYDPKDYKMSFYIDPVVDTWGDLMNLLAGVLFAPPDQQPAALEKYLGVVKGLHGIIEKSLKHHGGRFAAGDKVTIADFVMASYIGNYVFNANCPVAEPAKSTLGATPGFEAYC